MNNAGYATIVIRNNMPNKLSEEQFEEVYECVNKYASTVLRGSGENKDTILIPCISDAPIFSPFCGRVTNGTNAAVLNLRMCFLKEYGYAVNIEVRKQEAAA